MGEYGIEFCLGLNKTNIDFTSLIYLLFEFLNNETLDPWFLSQLKNKSQESIYLRSGREEMGGIGNLELFL